MKSLALTLSAAGPRWLTVLGRPWSPDLGSTPTLVALLHSWISCLGQWLLGGFDKQQINGNEAKKLTEKLENGMQIRPKDSTTIAFSWLERV